MKKIFAASLVAMMAVTAANADIASTGYVNERTGEVLTGFAAEKGNLNEAVNALVSMVGTENVGEQISDALTEAKGYTDSLANGAVKANTEAIAALDGTYATDAALTDGLALKEDITNRVPNFDSNNVSDYKYPSSSAVKNYVDNAVEEISNDVDVTLANYATKAELEAEETARTDADTALANRVTANEGAIDAIEKSDYAKSGVTSATVAQVATNKTDIANIKTEQTTQNNNISALRTSLAEGGATAKAIEDAKKAGTDATAALNAYKTSNDAAVNANTEAISNLDSTYATDTELNTAKSDITTAYKAADAETLAGAKQYADGLAGNYATAVQGTKADTAVQREQVGMAESFAVSEACKVNGVICSLTIKGTGTGAVAQWEVVK